MTAIKSLESKGTSVLRRANCLELFEVTLDSSDSVPGAELYLRRGE